MKIEKEKVNNSILYILIGMILSTLDAYNHSLFMVYVFIYIFIDYFRFGKKEKNNLWEFLFWISLQFQGLGSLIDINYTGPWLLILIPYIFSVKKIYKYEALQKIKTPIFLFCVLNIIFSIISIFVTEEEWLLRGIKNITIYFIPLVVGLLLINIKHINGIIIRSGVIISIAVIFQAIFSDLPLNEFKPNLIYLFTEQSWLAQYMALALVLEIDNTKYKLNSKIFLIMAAIAITQSFTCFVILVVLGINLIIFRKIKIWKLLPILIILSSITAYERFLKILNIYNIDDSSKGRFEVFEYLYNNIADYRNFNGFSNKNDIVLSGGVGIGPLGSNYISQGLYLHGWSIVVCVGILMFVGYSLYKKRELKKLNIWVILFVNGLINPIFLGLNSIILMSMLLIG
jgi:hypothetical protein